MKLYLGFLLLWLSAFANAQVSSQDVLFTVDGAPIKAKEFIRVYNKNLDLVKDESQKDIDGYLQLFINYQLKVKEAKRLGLDKNPNYIKEFLGYKNQLVKNYLSDTKVTEALMKEAYNRMGYDVKASHILIRMDENETDTLKVYQDLMKLRDRIDTEGFERVKASVHDGKDVFAEDLGYFTAFKMVYEFENAAFNTKVGDISLPFRTRFGYHIVKIDDKRQSLGEVTVAHIMVMNDKIDSVANPQKRIQEIYRKLKQGEDFEALAKQFSEDKSSADRGGELAPFSSGQLSSPEFEAVAFGLKNKEDISEPFKTSYGWHIVQLVEKKITLPYNDVKGDIENRIKRDSRSTLINTSLANDLRKHYKISVEPKANAYFRTILNPDFFSRAWVLPNNFQKSNILLTIGEENITYEAFGQHLMGIQNVYVGKTMPFKTIIEKEYNNFEEAMLLKYHEEHLEFENEDFAQILNEYRDGLLLFDLMEKEIWNAAASDTLGLKDYYRNHKNDYFWDDRVDVVIASAAKEKDIKMVEKLLRKGRSTTAISDVLNTEQEQKVIFTTGVKPMDYEGFPKNEILKKGLTKIFQYNNAYHIILVNEILPRKEKTFEDAKGKIISDYQNRLEENWLKTLNERYRVDVNADVLEHVKSQIKNKN